MSGGFTTSCVISSFITKPQRTGWCCRNCWCCVISSFITKPQPEFGKRFTKRVALYPLSSPNHNLLRTVVLLLQLRYILFHHQTTTCLCSRACAVCCVISSFITKPQQRSKRGATVECCVISSFITKPQHFFFHVRTDGVALYPLSSPNHNILPTWRHQSKVALYPLSSPNHN